LSNVEVGKVITCNLKVNFVRIMSLQVAVVLHSNTVELYSLHVALKEAESRSLRKISSQGHHSEVRTVAFSSDNLAIVSGCAESLKMWNR
jgi:U3 small nucleolar RNA-associated protein 12